MRSIWRRHYNLPPNDPRFLSMTDDELQWDLLQIAIHATDEKRQMEADRQTVLDLQKDMKGIADMVDRSNDFTQAKTTQKALMAVLGREKPATRIERITLTMD